MALTLTACFAAEAAVVFAAVLTVDARDLEGRVR
jgi:hypothetical protein